MDKIKNRLDKLQAAIKPEPYGGAVDIETILDKLEDIAGVSLPRSTQEAETMGFSSMAAAAAAALGMSYQEFREWLK